MEKGKGKKGTYVKRPNHYVDNAELLNALIEYRTKINEAEREGKEPPPVSNYIGDCFIKIAQHLSYLHNFINYSYLDEMRSDAIENCLAAVKNFDPNKTQNPFAYFTQVSYYAFVRRIQKEKKQQKIKEKIYDSMSIDFQEVAQLTQTEILDSLNSEKDRVKEKKKKESNKATLPIDDD